MRRVTGFLMFALVVAIGLVVRAAEPAPADYSKAMKDLGGLMQALGKPGASEDFELAKKSAATARDAFAIVQAYWKAKGDTTATKLAETGTKAAADLNVVATLVSSEGVEAAVKDLAATCVACHAAHREKMPDGSFQIK